MKITAIIQQIRNFNRVNVSVDGKYSFSLDISQIGELGIKQEADYTETQINHFKSESDFGKLFSRTLEYSLSRPHSSKEIRDYLYRKTIPSRDKKGVLREGISSGLTERVLSKLVDKGYVNDRKFATFWVENRMQKKGVSQRRLKSELAKKGIPKDIVEDILSESDRIDSDEIRKVIKKKRSKYPDEQKFTAYLARLGFAYDDIREAIREDEVL